MSRVNRFERRKVRKSSFQPWLEKLEDRTLLNADLPSMQNSADPLDVNGDGFVAQDDAQMVVQGIEASRQGAPVPTGYLDVTGDGEISPKDAVKVFGFLRRGSLYSLANRIPIRTLDGSDNNRKHPEWGSTGEALMRMTSVAYEDGISTPAGAGRPSPRAVSNAISAQTALVENARGFTDLTWVWGQFIDHDIDLTGAAEPAEPWAIPVPAGDPYFDPDATGTATIDFSRSAYQIGTGDSAANPRQQINQISAFLDGSAVYGSTEERAKALRTFDGGKLKTSEGDLLPFNSEGLENAGGNSDTLFLAGDIRANENVALTSMHTVWVREHNRIATELARGYPRPLKGRMYDEMIYQSARAIVIAQIQAITYNEFLPTVLGADALEPYRGYDRSVNPGIGNIFSTGCYRFGHSMLSPELMRLADDGTTIDAGNLALRDAFFAPGEIMDHGIDSILRGAANQVAQQIDPMVVDDVRNFLFGPPGAGGFDLASLNIQRGRDHGLPDYNQARIDLGLEPVESFDEITSDPAFAEALEQLYGDVNNVDVWAAGLAENHMPNAGVGELMYTVMVDQFERIRDGDRHWYQKVFKGHLLKTIEQTTLSDVIQRNTNVTGLQQNVFLATR